MVACRSRLSHPAHFEAAATIGCAHAYPTIFLLCARDRHIEGVILVGIAHRARGTGQETDVAVPVVAIEGWRPRAARELIFADPLQAVSVGLRHCAAHQFVEYLGVASRVKECRPGTQSSRRLPFRSLGCRRRRRPCSPLRV